VTNIEEHDDEDDDLQVYRFTCFVKQFPSDYTEAINNKEAQNLIVAMNDELHSLHKNNTWVSVENQWEKYL